MLAKQLARARDRARDALSLTGEVTLMEGIERHSGEPLRVCYLGRTDYQAFWASEWFREGFGTQKLRRTINLRDPFALVPEGVDLAVADLPWPYYRWHSKGRTEMPGWIVQYLSLAGSWDDVVARFRKNTRTTDLRKIRKHAFEFRTTSDTDDLQIFYDEMYLPYTRARFGGVAVLEPFETVRSVATGRGRLVQVILDGQVVAGVVVSEAGDVSHLVYLGVREGLERGLTDGALSAVYFGALRSAHEVGSREFSFGLTRPLLSDGIYRYKRKWGSELRDPWRENAFLWQVCRLTPATRAFLEAHPMVVRGPAGLGVHCYLPGGDAARLAEWLRGCWSSGLAWLHVFSDVPRPADLACPEEMVELHWTQWPAPAAEPVTSPAAPDEQLAAVE